MENRVVTPEAVVLELPTAGVATRSFARLFDLFLQAVVAFFLTWLLITVYPSGSQLIGVLLVFVVLIVLPVATEHFVMLKRSLVYTGITRGKKLVVVVGSRKALEMAVKSAEEGRRNSGLCERLRDFLRGDGVRPEKAMAPAVRTAAPRDPRGPRGPRRDLEG